MSDNDDEETPHPFQAFIPVDMAEAHDRQMMANETAHHQVQQLFDSLNIEQLATLRMIFDGISGTGSPRVAAAYHEAICATTLYLKFGVCTGCGKDHAEELLNMSTNEAEGNDGD